MCPTFKCKTARSSMSEKCIMLKVWTAPRILRSLTLWGQHQVKDRELTTEALAEQTSIFVLLEAIGAVIPRQGAVFQGRTQQGANRLIRRLWRTKRWMLGKNSAREQQHSRYTIKSDSSLLFLYRQYVSVQETPQV